MSEKENAAGSVRDAAEAVVEITLDEICEFPSHPFRVQEDAAFEEMAESIRQYGVLIPALVRPRAEGGYEMISGHRRMAACRRVGLKTIPCLVRELDDDQAILAMVDSNLQRESLLPSEKAFAYRLKLEAMRRQQGARSDLTSATALQKSEKLSSRELLAENSPDSHEQIRKYIRLTYLIPALLDKVDKGRLSLRSAVELSYLKDSEQIMLNYFIGMVDLMPSQGQAAELRRLSREGTLNERSISGVLQDAKAEKARQFRLPKSRISQFFKPGTTEKDMEETIVKALAFYQENRRDET